MKQIALMHATSKALLKLRHDRDQRQKGVASGSAMDYSVYNRLEAGLSHMQLWHVVGIAAHYGISPGELVNLIMAEKEKI